jgi:hypothetical protein
MPLISGDRITSWPLGDRGLSVSFRAAGLKPPLLPPLSLFALRSILRPQKLVINDRECSHSCGSTREALN